MIELWVPGHPAAQGSKRYVGHRAGKAVLVEQSKAVKPWRDAITQLLAVKMHQQQHPVLTGPVHVALTFRVKPPQRQVRDHPTTRPDLDKLTRAVLDAATAAGVWGDDAQVVSLHARKLYAPTGTTAGVRIIIDNYL